jgi:hypothetical protein
MLKTIITSCSLFVALTAGISTTGNAHIITTDGTILTDTTGLEGLEWLPLTETAGMSRSEVESNLFGTTAYEGYRYATRLETELLLGSYFEGNLLDYDFGETTNTAEAADSFINDFGALDSDVYELFTGTDDLDNPISYDGYRSSYFIYGAETTEDLRLTDAILYGGVDVILNGESPVAGIFMEYFGTDSSHVRPSYIFNDIGEESIGSLLVKDNNTPANPVPEPTTLILFSTGLLGLFGVSRTRAKKK